MSTQLAKFLETCWAFRNNVNLQDSEGKLDLYLLYCGRVHEQQDRPDEWTHGATQSIPRFFEGLASIGSGYEIMIQPYGILGEVLEDTEFDRDGDGRLMIARILNRARRSPDLWGPVLWDLAMSFVHFIRNGAPAMRRVYLNVRPACRVQVCKFLATELLDISEAGRFKVLGPLQKGYDTIVIYVANDDGVLKVLKSVAEYQTSFAAYFDFPVINIAKPAKHHGKALRGVAVATEPGDFQTIAPIHKRNPSFGDFWERLLLPFLADSKTETMFFQNALATMKKLGINPMYPYKFLRK